MEMFKENNDIIKRAYQVIYNDIDETQLSENEKHAIRMLIEKLMSYYDKRLSLMSKKDNSINPKDAKVIMLESMMTDILVDINSVINGGIDVYYFISIINKKLNDKDIESIIKSKRK